MNYLSFRELFKDFTILSLAEIRSADPAFQRRRLNDWQEKGYLRKVLKGWYIFGDRALTEDTIFEIANRIYAPAYVSLETALAVRGLIPEAIYGITSATTRPTRSFRTPPATFLYRTLKPSLFFGYEVEAYSGQKHYSIATPEKAILDYFYLNPAFATPEDFESLRVNADAFHQQIRESVLLDYLGRFAITSLAVRINRFWRFMQNA